MLTKTALRTRSVSKLTQIQIVARYCLPSKPTRYATYQINALPLFRLNANFLQTFNREGVL